MSKVLIISTGFVLFVLGNVLVYQFFFFLYYQGFTVRGEEGRFLFLFLFCFVLLVLKDGTDTPERPDSLPTTFRNQPQPIRRKGTATE